MTKPKASKIKDEKVVISASFEELVKESVEGNPTPKSKLKEQYEKLSPESKKNLLQRLNSKLLMKKLKGNKGLNSG
jgi:hypothetical protein